MLFLWLLCPAVAGAQGTTPKPGGEPSLREVLNRADTVGVSGGETALMRRARWRGLVPVVRLGVRHGRGVDHTVPLSGDVTRHSSSSDRDLTLQAWLTFRLDRLVQAPEEGALLRQRRVAQRERRAHRARLVALYFERLRLRAQWRGERQRTVENRMRFLEVTRLLDLYTGFGLSHRWVGIRARSSGRGARRRVNPTSD